MKKILLILLAFTVSIISFSQVPGPVAAIPNIPVGAFPVLNSYQAGVPILGTSNLFDSGTQLLYKGSPVGGGPGGGLTSFTVQNLSPVFSASLGPNPTTSPTLNFTLSPAAANTILGNCTTLSTAPSYCALTLPMLPTGIPNSNLANPYVSINGQSCALGLPCTIPVGNLTSAGLTATFVPVANGPNSQQNSLITDDGTTLRYSGSGGLAITGTGSGNGGVSLPAGGALSPPPANYVGYAQSLTVTTPFFYCGASAPYNGLSKKTVSGNCDQDSPAVPGTDYDAAGAASTAANAAQAAAIASSAQKTANLSDLASAPTARTNLGLGTAATSNTTAFDVAGAAATAILPFTNTQTAGAGGVVANTFVGKDTSNPIKMITASLGACGEGIALNSAAAGFPVIISDAVGTQQVLTDGAVASGDIIIGSQITAGYAHDSGYNTNHQVPTAYQTCGVALTSTSASGQLVTINPYSRGTRGGVGQVWNPCELGVDCTGNISKASANVTALQTIINNAGAAWQASVSAEGSSTVFKGTPVVIQAPPGSVTAINATINLPNSQVVSIVEPSLATWRWQATGSAVAGAMLAKDGTTLIGYNDVSGIFFNAANIFANCFTEGGGSGLFMKNVNCDNYTSPTGGGMVFGDGVSTHGFTVFADNMTVREDSSYFSAGSQPANCIVINPPEADGNFDKLEPQNCAGAGVLNKSGDNTFTGVHGGGYSGVAWNMNYLIDDESPAGSTHIRNTVGDGVAIAVIRVGSAATANNGSEYVGTSMLAPTQTANAALFEMSTTAYNISISGSSNHGFTGAQSAILYDGTTDSTMCNWCSIDLIAGAGVNTHHSYESNITVTGPQAALGWVAGLTERLGVGTGLGTARVWSINHVPEFEEKMYSNGANPVYVLYGLNGGGAFQLGSSGAPNTLLGAGNNGYLDFNNAYYSTSNSNTNGERGWAAGNAPGILWGSSRTGIYTGPPVEPSAVKTIPLGAPTLAATGSITGGTLTAAGSPYVYYTESLDGLSNSLPSAVASCTIASGTTGSCTLNLTRFGPLGDNCYNIYGRTGTSSTVGLLTPTCIQLGSTVLTSIFKDDGSVTPTTAMPSTSGSGSIQGVHFATLGTPYNVVFGAAAGTTPGTATITGHDDFFTVSWTEGTGTIPLGTLFSISFQYPHTSATPDCGVLARTGDQFGKTGVQSTFTGGVTVGSAVALTAGATETVTVACGNL